MTDRRAFLAMILATSACGFSQSAFAKEPVIVKTPNPRQIPLWPNTPPGGGGPTGPVFVDRNGSISNIAIPMMDVYMPERPTGAAMLVAGGGGYKRIGMKSEAIPAAQWLNARGVIACVLRYRLPLEKWSIRPLAPLQDAQRALRLMRSGLVSPNINPKRIGVFGFSAGGHLMGLMAAREQFSSYTPIDKVDKLSAHANLSVLAYPVITLKKPYNKTSTCNVLIGRNAPDVLATEWSVETFVTKRNPPTFLIQANDDPIAKPINSLIMQQACEKAGVPVVRHVLPSGGHGFGIGKPNRQTANWPLLLEPWLKQYKMI